MESALKTPADARGALEGKPCRRREPSELPAALNSLAQAITHRASNGWRAWLYERARGDWVPLDDLRIRK